MTRIGILEPTTLLGGELRERLAMHPRLGGEIDLISVDEEIVGTVVDTGGDAGMIARWDAQAPPNPDLLFVCSRRWSEAAPLMEQLPSSTRRVILSPDADDSAGPACVAGVRDPDPATDISVRSPHAAAVALAHLLDPLRELGLERAVATVMQPVSALGRREDLDEVFDQTRRLLAFEPPGGQGEGDGLSHQVAFNLLPGHVLGNLRGDRVARTVRELLELPDTGEGRRNGVLGSRSGRVSVQLVTAGVFHALAISLWLELGEGVTEHQIRDALSECPALEHYDAETPLSPLAAAGSELVLWDGPESTGEPDEPGFWLWAVADNLTVGGAINAIALAERLVL